MKLTAQVLGQKQFEAAVRESEGQARFAAALTLNEAGSKGIERVKKKMTNVFDKPTPWVLNSLRLKRATKTNLVAEVAFKDRNSAESSRTMVAPHVDGGKRAFKGMEGRLARIGLLPAGWYAVPGQGAKLDAFGNMSRGQISQLLNMLGTYTEAGYNKADARTAARLAKGNVKKGVYGFTYWVNKVGAGVGKHLGAGVAHLPAGVYQRHTTPFGSSLKPVLIFVRGATYRRRLDFYETIQATASEVWPVTFPKTFQEAMRTAIPKHQGSLL